MEKDQLRKKLINDSGFLLQLAVERDLKKLTYGPRPTFGSIVSEYPWIDPLSNRGFIDLIATQTAALWITIRFVIECKRVSDCDWIFVTSTQKERSGKGHFRWVKTKIRKNTFPHGCWHEHSDFPLINPIQESDICVVQGQDKDKPMMERLSGNLLQSIEGLASEDGATACDAAENMFFFYIPVLITTASLFCTSIDPEMISVSDGKAQDAHFEKASAVLFRKSLVAEPARRAASRSLEFSKGRRERSVLVVNSERVTEILSVFKVNWTLFNAQNDDFLGQL